MAEQEVQQEVDVDEHEEVDKGYKVPVKKELDEILQTDADDESLQKYKEKLLGSGKAEPFPEDPRQVIVTELAMVVEGRDDVVLNISDSGKGKVEVEESKPYTIKEGTEYKMRIRFYVQREIVTGLKYVQKVHRKGIKVSGTNLMVGSYGPKMEVQEFVSPKEEAPTGVIGRGEYSITSSFTDDDKSHHLELKWKLKVSKDWKDN